MPALHEPKAEPIPGYKLLEPLGSGGFGEVWKCEAPGGIFKAIKFVYGDINGLAANSARAEEELRAIQHIKTIRHPFLLSIDRVEIVEGELVIVTELADRNLEELLQAYRAKKRTGIPRGELLNYLREAAEVLDLMNIHYQLQHLDVKPRNLFLVSNHVKVADFGLVNSLGNGGKAGVHLGAISPLYASPELFLGQLSRHSDQYSLAIVYLEMLTGTLPFAGKNVRQLLLQHTREEPNLAALPERDRAMVARALSKDPEKRYKSCMEFVLALLREPTETAAAATALVSAASNKRTEAAPADACPVETVSNFASDSDTWTGRKSPPLPGDVLPGYRFLECVGNSPLMDQWRVQAPDGAKRILKLIYGYGLRDKRLEDAILQLKSLQHPALAAIDVVHVEPGRLVLLTDVVKENLRDQAVECQSRKFPGIMRGELLDYMRTAAEALDYLYNQHSIQHLGLNPRNLVLLDDGRLQIADFGLAQLLWLPAGQALAQRNARYAAPELFDRHPSRACDQYSLALIYAELLTGLHPLRGPSKAARGTEPPSLDKLPDVDRAVVARALDADPAKRWPSCMDMVRALEGSTTQTVAQEQPDRFTSMVSTPRPNTAAANLPTGTTPEDLNDIIRTLIKDAGGEVPRDQDQPPVLSQNGELLEFKFQAGLPLGSARMKLDGFCQQWYGQLRKEDENGCVFHISMPSNFWRQWIGRQPGLEVHIRLARVQALSATPIEVAVQIRAFRCSKKRGQQLLCEMGPSILDTLRSHLLVNSEKRMHDRLLWPHPLKIRPVSREGNAGEVIQCQGKDISLSGIGFYLPEELETSDVLIELPNTLRPPTIPVPATLVRAKRCADGWYDVGALFCLPALRKSFPEMQMQ